MIRIVFLIGLLLFSCKTDNKSQNIESGDYKELSLQTKKNFQPSELEGHTFFKVSYDEKKDTILYKYCFAEIRTYRIYEDKIFLNYGQEYYFMNIKNVIRDSNSIKYTVRVYFQGEEFDEDQLFTFKNLDKKKKYWQINDEIYIDSLFSHEIPLVKEADPCPDWEDY